MTGTRVAALVMIPLAIVAGVFAGRYWHVAHMPPAAMLADHPIANAPASTTSGPDAPAPETSAPAPSAPKAAQTSPTTAPAPVPAPAKPAPQVAARVPEPAIRSLPPLASVKPAPVPSDSADDRTPTFDVVRVEPQGDAVVAGKGAPNARVALLSGGKVVGEAKSDAAGQFVILPQRLAPGDHALTLRQTPDGQPSTESAQSVAVSVPQPGKGKSVVALAEPGKATKLLSPPPGANAPNPVRPTEKVVIRSAELENGNGLYVSGAAKPGTPVHLYLNDAHIADVVAGADGAWSVRVKHGLTGGHYAVRADAGGAAGKVASRAEVPFDVPVAMAEKPAVVAPPAAVASAASAPAVPGRAEPEPAVAAKTAQAAPASAPTPSPARTADAGPVAEDSASSSSAETAKTPEAETAKTPEANTTIDTIATTLVTRGDNLWNISRFRLGQGMRYTQIYAANTNQIRDPNLIYPGQVLVVPNR